MNRITRTTRTRITLTNNPNTPCPTHLSAADPNTLERGGSWSEGSTGAETGGGATGAVLHGGLFFACVYMHACPLDAFTVSPLDQATRKATCRIRRACSLQPHAQVRFSSSSPERFCFFFVCNTTRFALRVRPAHVSRHCALPADTRGDGWSEGGNNGGGEIALAEATYTPQQPSQLRNEKSPSPQLEGGAMQHAQGTFAFVIAVLVVLGLRYRSAALCAERRGVILQSFPSNASAVCVFLKARM
jgi:hypothetical protein